LTDENWDQINFGELGRDWWFENGATVGATTQQIIFSACRFNGMTMTGSAKMAQYSGDESTIRQSGHRAAHSTAVMSLLSLAAAETGRGPDGNVDMAEAKRILSRLARNAEPLTRIRSIETLAKISRDEHELNLRQAEQATNLNQEIAEMAKISPELAEAFAQSKGVAWSSKPGNGATNE
jgi:hypothetical protein